MIEPVDIKKYGISQVFNDICCRQSYAKFGMIGHNGTDIKTPCGTAVVAAFNGTVYSGFEANGYGNYIFIRDDAGNEAVYGHLSRIDVRSGRVSEGQQIGLSGTTGNSSGCHLHFGYRPAGYNRNNGFLGYVNPVFGQQNNSQPAKKGAEVMWQGEDAFARANDMHLKLRGRTLDRAIFNQLVANGTGWLKYVEILSDDPEANEWQRNAQVGQVARRDNWEGQINSLLAQLKQAQNLVNEMNERLVKSENTTKALTEKVEKLNAKVTELDSPDKIVVTRSFWDNLFSKIKDFFERGNNE